MDRSGRDGRDVRQVPQSLGGLPGAVDGYREIDDDRVLALGHRTGWAKASGFDLAQMQNQYATIFEIHDGKMTRLVLYADRDRALADLGLEA